MNITDEYPAKRYLGRVFEIHITRHNNSQFDRFEVVLVGFHKGEWSGYTLSPSQIRSYHRAFFFEQAQQVEGFIMGIEQIFGLHFTFFSKLVGKDSTFYVMRRNAHFETDPRRLSRGQQKNEEKLKELNRLFNSGKWYPVIGTVNLNAD